MNDPKRKVAFYGGSFDPVHIGHLEIADELIRIFAFDEFVFIPAFHAPHKSGLKPTSPFHRYAMLSLATNDDSQMRVSKLELELPEKPYTVETLSRLREKLHDTDIYFVMGADSWQDILTWREWERVLTMSNHVVVTRPGYDISTDHVTDEIRGRIVDARGRASVTGDSGEKFSIYFTDAVNQDISATEIRRNIRDGGEEWRGEVTEEVAKYIEKYQIYR